MILECLLACWLGSMGNIRHAFTSPKVDDVDATLVRPSDWNSSHAYTLVDGLSAGTQVASSGTISFADSNGVTFGLNNNTLTASVAAAGGGLTNVRVSAGTTSNLLSQITFADSNGVSFGLNASTLTATVATSLTNVRISAGTTSNLLSALTFADSNGLGWGLNASTLTGSYTQDTTPPIGTAVKPVQTSGSTGTITRFAPEDHAHQGCAGIDVQGVASTFFGTYQLSAGNLISLATGGNTSRGSAQIIDLLSSATTVSSVATANVIGAMASRFALEGHQHGGVPTVSVVGNTAGNTTQGNLSLILAGGPNITLSGGTAAGAMTLSVSAAAAGGAATYSNYFENFPFAGNVTGSATTTASNSQLFVQPFSLPVNLSFGQLNLIGSHALATSAGNTFSFRLTPATNMRLVGNVSVTNSHLFDFFLMSRGTGGFSSEIETVASTRNTIIQHLRHTWDNSISAAAANSTGSASVRQTVSISMTYPTMTSATTTSINAATTVTIWGTGTSSWSGTASNSTSQTYNTTTTGSTSIASTHPAITEWSSYKLWPFAFASSITPGEWYLGIKRNFSTSSSLSTSNTNATGTGNSYTSTWNVSALTQSGSYSWVGRTHTLASSLGWPGGNTVSYMAPSPGLGSFSGTWAHNTTYLNNAGNPAGAVAYTQLRTHVSFFDTWFQLASNRI